MNRWGSFTIGAVLGATLGMVAGYLFAPAEDADFDTHYRSRLDAALAEGKKAAEEREAELRRQFEDAKRRHAGPNDPSQVSSPPAAPAGDAPGAG